MTIKIAGPDLMLPRQVAAVYGVDVKTLTRWAKTGQLPRDCWIRTPGGHRRYRREVIQELLNKANGS